MPFLTPFIFIFLKCSENLLRYIAGANIYYILKEKLKFKEREDKNILKKIHISALRPTLQDTLY